MAINIFGLQPNKVNRNLLGYSFLFYGDPKTGKTTIASKFPKALLLAFEKGYAAIPGIIAQPINSWSEFKKVLKQLKEEQAKELFETIILDTGDIAYDYDIKYVCDNAKRPDGGYGVDSIGDIPYGKGYALAVMAAYEFVYETCLSDSAATVENSHNKAIFVEFIFQYSKFCRSSFKIIFHE